MRNVALGLLVVVALFAAGDVRAEAQTPTEVSDGCWGVSVNKDNPCYSSGGYGARCIKPTNYETCKKYCDCGYQENLKKCNSKRVCMDWATAERNACYGNCITDWA